MSWSSGCGRRLRAVGERRVRARGKTFKDDIQEHSKRTRETSTQTTSRPLHKDARFLPRSIQVQPLLLRRLLMRLLAPSLADRFVVQRSVHRHQPPFAVGAAKCMADVSPATRSRAQAHAARASASSSLERATEARGCLRGVVAGARVRLVTRAAIAASIVHGL